MRDFDASTKSSELAAKALGCTIAEIAKSVVFVGDETSVVIISGDKRVDVAKLEKAAGGKARKADADEVRDRTGYPIGGVPPFPHSSGVSVYLDSSLKRHKEVWAAAGSPNSVFRVSVEDLLKTAGKEAVDLAA